MDHGLFVEYNNQVIQFPVNPEFIEFRRDSNNSTTDIVSLGEINILGVTHLAECRFEGFFPTNRHSSFVRTSGNFWQPSQYINFFERIREECRPCRFIVTNTNINMLVSIEFFDYKHEYAEGEVFFKLGLKEFRNHSAREVVINITPTQPRVATSPAPSTSTNRRVTTGSRVIVNGRLHRDSFGSGPGLTEQNATRIINIIAQGRSHPYHVALVGGGNRGWVRAQDVRLV